MSILQRNNVSISGDGSVDMVFAHGYGCDKNMWRLLTPAFEERYRIITYDLVGSGRSDLKAYDRDKYASLRGHASDVLEIIDHVARGPVIFVGHSVSAMIGLLAGVARPASFQAQIMIGPSPCYINHADYFGGFVRSDLDALLETLDANYLGWSRSMAPVIMGAPDRPELGIELSNSFCQTDPEIAKHFARVTFLSDNRGDLPNLAVRSLVMQNTDDIIAPKRVGEYVHRTLPNSALCYVENVGHCPHLSEPAAVAAGMNEFLAA